jgi:uncharacterized protein (TIGR03437 family)
VTYSFQCSFALGGHLNFANSSIRRLALTCGTLMLAGAGQLAAQVGTALTSNNLSFAHQQSSLTAPQPQTVRVLSNPTSLSFTATATTNTGGAWLLVNGATTATGTTGAVSQDLQVSISPLGLPGGSYTGTITVNVAGASPNIIGVSLTVSTAPQVVISPNSLFLQAQAGTQTSTLVTVNSTGAAIPFTASVSSISPNFPLWLSVTPPSGNTGSSVTVIANATNLQAGLAVGTITFAAQTPGGGSVTVPVTLNVGGASTLVVNPTSTSIAFQLGTSQPGSKQISVTTSNSSAIQYTAQVTAGTWLTLSSVPSSIPGSTVLTGSTPNPFYAVANPAGLGAGTYDGKVLVTSPSIPGSSQEVAVKLIVSTQPLLQSIPESVTFNHTLGTIAPVGQPVSILSTSGQPLLYQAAATTASGGDWLTVSPSFGTTSQTNIQVGLNPARVSQLTSGAYAGTVTITAAGAANSPFTIPVTLNISGSTLINVQPAQLNFQMQQGQTPPAQSFAITSTDGSNQPFNISTEYQSTTTGWLLVSPTFGSTGATGVLISANVIPAAINAPGTYDATIVITPLSTQGSAPQRIPVKLTVTGSATVTATPTSLEFTQAGTTAPQAQTVNVTSTVAGLTYLAGSTQPWITVAPATGTLSSTATPLTIGVTSTGLTPGTNYEGSVTVSVSGVTTLTIPVRFSYQNSAAMAVSSNQLRFDFQTGGTAPAAQNLGVTSNGVPIAFTAAATTASGGNWLTINPTSGTTAATGGAATNIAVTANPAGLVAGTYTGTITLTSSNASNSPLTVAVTLVVAAPSPPVITAVQSAASNAPTAVSAGLIMAVKGTNLGPTTGVGAQVTGGFVTTQLGDVRVLFDNVPAPMLFARQDQVNVVAPYFVSTRTSTRVIVEYKGVRSDPVDLRVVETAPGIFTADASGNGQGAILNQDNTANSASNPAARGSIVVLYATGEGATTPAGSDGRVITATELRRPLANVTVRIGGQLAEVLYAGSAPGLVSGGFQVNARVPQLQIGAATATPVELIVGTGSSATTQNVTLMVRP